MLHVFTYVQESEGEEDVPVDVSSNCMFMYQPLLTHATINFNVHAGILCKSKFRMEASECRHTYYYIVYTTPTSSLLSQYQ